jgi:hypothetical protein
MDKKGVDKYLADMVSVRAQLGVSLLKKKKKKKKKF